MKTRDEVRAIYDRRAPDYDRSVGRTEGWLLGDLRRAFAEEMAGDVLEVGIGSGLNLAGYPPAVRRAVGLDLSGGMLAIARERAAALGRTVALVQGDAQRLPFADASFDTVGVSLTLCTVAEPAKALAEMARVCRLGGRVVLLEHVLSPVWPVALGERLLSPLQERLLGCHLTRETVAEARRLGFVVESERERVFGVLRLVVARPPRRDGLGSG
jgi:ubiquinone/menaquinone biosynthesis C-methylase UbiE